VLHLTWDSRYIVGVDILVKTVSLVETGSLVGSQPGSELHPLLWLDPQTGRNGENLRAHSDLTFQ
jgi:hypothetical protein